MAQPTDPASLTVEERLRLIEELWSSIEKDAERGDPAALEALAFDDTIDPKLLAEFERRADELERDPSKGVRWEDLREELRRKYG
ncbi:MAG: addiction module protein [Reyranella sp.]|uniref:addiction module protein n=1 Tax=Reyranella sp. TaxID=1929291 RepID=UPI001AC82FA1|nr:addiction module protein [Reyranella sp.]MBN9090336.1 addiction module protein [Reyranella sp.]